MGLQLWPLIAPYLNPGRKVQFLADLMNESINEKIMVSKFIVLHKNKILCSKLLRVRILMFYPLSYLQTNKTSHKNNVTFKYLCCDAHNCIKSKSHVDVENINQKGKKFEVKNLLFFNECLQFCHFILYILYVHVCTGTLYCESQQIPWQLILFKFTKLIL